MVAPPPICGRHVLDCMYKEIERASSYLHHIIQSDTFDLEVGECEWTAPISCKAGRGQCQCQSTTSRIDFNLFYLGYFCLVPKFLPFHSSSFFLVSICPSLEANPKKISMRIWCVAIWPSPLRPCITPDVNIIEMEKKELSHHFSFSVRFFEVNSVPYSLLDSRSCSRRARSFHHKDFSFDAVVPQSRGCRITRAGSLLFGRGTFFLFKFGSESQFFFSLAFVYFCVYV